MVPDVGQRAPKKYGQIRILQKSQILNIVILLVYVDTKY
jgi:hypothetical protein